MDPLCLVRECMLSPGHRASRNPFTARPWLQDTAAAAAASGNIGLKGIVAGKYLIRRKILSFSTLIKIMQNHESLSTKNNLDNNLVSFQKRRLEFIAHDRCQNK